MRFLHTMLRVRDLDAALAFYQGLLGLEEVRRRVDFAGANGVQRLFGFAQARLQVGDIRAAEGRGIDI